MNDFVKPGFPTPPTNQEKVRLYFLGVELSQAMSGRDVVFYTKDAAWVMPPLGDYIEVSANVANDLIHHSYWSGSPTLVAGAEGERLAKVLKEASKDGSAPTPAAIRQASAEQVVSQLSEAELEAVIAKVRSKNFQSSAKKIQVKEKEE